MSFFCLLMIMFVRFSVSLLVLFMTLRNTLVKLVDSGDCSIMQKFPEITVEM